MDLAKHKQAQEDCIKWAQYYEAIWFPTIADAFREAAASLNEVIELLEKLNNPTMATITVSEEGANE